MCTSVGIPTEVRKAVRYYRARYVQERKDKTQWYKNIKGGTGRAKRERDWRAV